jgi:predicted acylesterase/phospholipase RssA
VADEGVQDGSASFSVALSGGGHRAALFGLGVLLYIAEAGRNRSVTSIASVSGGSITNGFFAQRPVAYDTASGENVAEAARDLTSIIVRRGSLLGRQLNNLILLPVAVLILIGWVVLALDAPLGLRVAIASGIGAAAGGVLAISFRGWLARLYIVLLVLSLFWAVGGPWLIPWPAPVRFLVTVATLAVWIWLVARLRSWVCEKAFEQTFFTRGGKPVLVSDIQGGLDHIFCATELQSSEQLYFSKDFVYGYRYGVGKPGMTTLARAVQASACLPFAFAPRWFRRADYKFTFPAADRPPAEDRAGATRFIVLTDGGVYDNMADQWAMGFASRTRAWPALATEHRQPTHLIVVNASAGRGWRAFEPSTIPGKDEIAGMLRIKDVQYDQTTAPRRRALVAAFNQAAAARAAMDKAGEHDDLPGAALMGALVDIGQSPFDVPKAFENNKDPQLAERAKQALAALRELGDSEEVWKAQQRESAGIGTGLSRLDADLSARLLRHAYVLAAVNLHVILGFPPRPLPGLDIFQAMTRTD